MAPHHCTYCQNVILTCRLKCVECTDFDLCLQCFACGVETGDHKKEHDYQVLEDGCFSVFEDNEAWSSADENLLLDAVEQYGFGNWEDVSNFVKTKTTEECRDHYYTFYIQGNIGKATFASAENRPNNVIDHSKPDGGPLSPSLTVPLPPLELNPLEQHELGYMPLRDDFEREYDNEAETLVSSLSIVAEDDELDTAVKLAQIDMYRQRLKERQHRKQTAREYDIIQNSTTVGLKKAQADKKKKSKEERDFHDKMRVFAQFHSPKEHEQFFDSLKREKRMKSRIKELMRYRRNGITKLEEGAEYDQERLRREKKKENKKKMGSSGSMKRTLTGSKKEKENGEDVDTIINENKSPKKSRTISSLPGGELLSEREKRLCHSIGMKPSSYITIKTCIIKDYLQRRQGMQVKIRYPKHLDKTHRRKILNFLNENGWIGGIGAL